MLSACGQTLQSGLDTYRPLWDAAHRDTTDRVELQPGLRYLRVTVNDQVGLMVRADLPSDTLGESRWYSADGSVLKLSHGRMVGWADRFRSWTVVQDGAPPAEVRDARFDEMVDAQPGDRYGQRLVRIRQAGIGIAWPADFRLRTTGLQWVREQSPGPEGATASGTAWFGVDASGPKPVFVAGRRCVSDDWCVQWEPWPPKK